MMLWGTRHTKQQTLMGIAAASLIIFILKVWVIIPVGIRNETIDGSYAIIATTGIVFGAIPGMLTALIGTAAAHLVIYHEFHVVAVFCVSLMGFCMGLGSRWVPLREELMTADTFWRFNLLQMMVNVPIWFIVMPTLMTYFETYTQNEVIMRSAIWGLTNIVSIWVLGSIILTLYSVFQVDRENHFIYQDTRK